MCHSCCRLHSIARHNKLCEGCLQLSPIWAESIQQTLVTWYQWISSILICSANALEWYQKVISQLNSQGHKHMENMTQLAYLLPSLRPCQIMLLVNTGHSGSTTCPEVLHRHVIIPSFVRAKQTNPKSQAGQEHLCWVFANLKRIIKWKWVFQRSTINQLVFTSILADLATLR